jgi:hypothetical protein
MILLFLLWVVVGILGTWIFEFILKRNRRLRDRYYNRHEIILGYHIHHSIYGLLFLLAGIVLAFTSQRDVAPVYAAVGIGIIIMHTISSKRFVFIEKKDRDIATKI